MADIENRSAASLSDRVRSLRLAETSESGAPLWWLPWVACLALFFLTGFLALEAFAPISDDMLKKLAEERGLAFGSAEPKSTPLDKLGLSSSASQGTELALQSKGNIVPFSLVQVSPKITGTVMKLYIKEGMAVDKDVLLAELEDVEYSSDLARTENVQKANEAKLAMLQKYRPDEIKQAEAELNDAKAQRDQMSAKFERARELYKAVAIAPEEFESAESANKSMKERVRRLQIAYDFLKDDGPRDAQIALAKAELRQADADLVKAQWRYDNTKVKAPIKGIILSKKTEEGNIVNPQAFSNGLSASLCEMADLHNLEVDLSIAERDIGKLFENQDCRITAEAFPNRIYPGYVSRIMPMADRSKSSVPVRVKVEFPAVDPTGKALPKDSQGQFLRPEMGAIVTFLNRKAPGKK